MEQPLLPYEACNLGSINVNKLRELEQDEISNIVGLAVRFLDNVINIGAYPLPQIKEKVLQNRKIGLGIMGLADALSLEGFSYASEAGRSYASTWMQCINQLAHKASEELAERIMEGEGVRMPASPSGSYNACVTTIAPTGTISMIAECSGGCEPHFALAYDKNVLDSKFTYINPHLVKALKAEDLYTEEIISKIKATGTLRGLSEIPESIKKAFITAQEISPEDHVEMQAALQEHVDSSISKTINFGNEATVEDIKQAYLLAHKLKCKGLTVYRNGSRTGQVLTAGTGETEEAKAPEVKVNHDRPEVVEGKTARVKLAESSLYVTVNFLNQKPFEIFTSIGKAGGADAAQSEALGRLASLALRAGVDVAEVTHQLAGIRGPVPVWNNGDQYLSIPDAISKMITSMVTEEPEVVELGMGDIDFSKEENIMRDTIIAAHNQMQGLICPKCNQSTLRMTEGCMTCSSCGHSKCS